MTSITYQAGIYPWTAELRPISTMMDPNPPPIFVIPGMRVGCLPYSTVFSGTLECFYDQLCLNTTAKFISTLSSNDWPSALTSTGSRFQPNEALSVIFGEQMVEDWGRANSFADYYKACTPYECSYTTLVQNSYVYLITLLLSLFGGLTVALKFISPLIVHVGHMIHGLFIRKHQTKVRSRTRKLGNTQSCE